MWVMNATLFCSGSMAASWLLHCPQLRQHAAVCQNCIAHHCSLVSPGSASHASYPATEPVLRHQVAFVLAQSAAAQCCSMLLYMQLVSFLTSCCLHLQHDRARRSLCERLKPYSLPAGHDACQEGDECDNLWLLTEGAHIFLLSVWCCFVYGVE